MIAPKLHEKIKLYTAKLEQFADRAWYPPLIGLLAALDNIIIIIPNDGILIASSMIVPKRWFIFAICVTIGSTLGAWMLAALVEHQGLPFVLEYFPGINESQMWIKTDEYFIQYGLLVVFAVAASPLVQQPIVILAALASIPVLKIAAVIFAGRLIKFLVMAYLGSHSPKYLKKIWGIKDELKDAGVKLDE
jgi:membrane protein YqaA with SNARE-associated domain